MRMEKKRTNEKFHRGTKRSERVQAVDILSLGEVLPKIKPTSRYIRAVVQPLKLRMLLEFPSRPEQLEVAQEENLALLCTARSTFTREQSGAKKDAVLSHGLFWRKLISYVLWEGARNIEVLLKFKWIPRKCNFNYPQKSHMTLRKSERFRFCANRSMYRIWPHLMTPIKKYRSKLILLNESHISSE